ncbi:MAG: MATE family efflux transporter [Butyricicoccus sp.]|nr:MATE family efflux transporter [Butyricicoccus sp.]
MKPVREKYDFTDGPILPQLSRFMLPILGALLLQAMYGAVDILVVGRFGTTAGISGVSTGSNIINLVIFTIAGLSTAITVLIARYIGERRMEDAGKVIGGAIAFFSALSVVLAILLLLLARPFAVLMQAPAEALDATVTYVRICGGGIFFIIAYNVISSVFRGMGNSRLPLIFVAIACVVNIFADLLFVAVFHWDVAGAALATVLAQAVSVILSLLIIKKEGLPFPFSKKDIGFNGEIRNILLIGAPIAFQEIMTNLSFLALCAFINRLGLTLSSAYGVANKIVSFVMLLPSTLMQSMSSFIAQNVGAGREDRARRAMLTGMGIGCAIGVVVMCFSFFRGDLLAQIFTEDAPVIAAAADYLRGFASEAIVTCILFSFMSYFNGHGQTVFVMAQGLAQTFIVRLPVSYVMSILPNTNLMLIGTAAPAATIFGIALNILYYRRFQKQMETRHPL